MTALHVHSASKLVLCVCTCVFVCACLCLYVCVSFCVFVSASVCASVCKLTCMPMCGCCFCISSLLFVILSLIFNVFDLPVLHQALGAEPLMHVYCGQNL